MATGLEDSRVRAAPVVGHLSGLDPLPGSRPPPTIRSLAVLLLENLSNDVSQDYFSDGMTDELITELGQFSELFVISRTSAMTYKGARKPLPQIARGVARRRRGGRHRFAFGEPGSNHSSIDPGVR